jgi:dienelactone hydrolase
MSLELYKPSDGAIIDMEVYMSEQLYESSKNPAASKQAVIVLPEIFGMNKFIRVTTDKFAQELNIKSFALDHFYPVTGKSQVYDYGDHEEPMKAMQQVTGEGFVDQFTTALDEIAKANPDTDEFIVCGFCFGGRLSFLTALDDRVKRIVSFYGSRANDPEFYQDKSVIEALCEARGGDQSLKVLALYGDKDPTLPVEARTQTKNLIEAAGINFQEKVYDAGHAFMNFERSDMHSQQTSQKAWADVKDFLKA